ncbi:MAG: hypothetical protein EOP90_11140 [Lysobacteraceae bacterium]|nr:MAG: hypothetical protein EOP90_11140 [Xanthomonadaceae bacterium]
MNRALFLVAFAATSAIALPAFAAQAPASGLVAVPLTDIAQPIIHGDSFKSIDHLRHQRGSHASRVDAPVGLTDADFSVQFDAGVSRDARADYIADVERSSGIQAARALDAWYDRHDAHALLRDAMAPYALRGDDFADVTTAWLVVMWSIANQAPMPSPESVQAVRMQTRASLLDKGRVPERAAERQRALEALVYQTVTLMHARDSAVANGDAAYLAELADSAQAGMRRQHFDLRAMAMTDAGLERR